MPAASGLERTLRVLRDTPNRAANAALVAALTAERVAIRTGAARALAARRDALGRHDLLMALHDCDDDVHTAVATPDMAKRLRTSVVAAIKGDDLTLCKRACRYVQEASDYAVLPMLIEMARQPEHPYGVGLATTALQLARSLCELIEAPRDTWPPQFDPAFVRSPANQALAVAVDRFAEHERLELVEAFLLLAPHDNLVLKRLLLDKSHACHEPLVETLLHSISFGAADVLWRLLGDSETPDSLLQLVTKRADKHFLARFFSQLSYPLPVRVAENAKRLPGFAWIEPARREAMLALSSNQQAIAVALTMATQLPPAEKVAFLQFILTGGKIAGRAAACGALESLRTPQAASLLKIALADHAPEVVAQAVGQLRKHDPGNAQVLLIEQLGHPSPLVRRAVQTQLREFNLPAFRDLFDQLDPEARQTAGELVARVDPDAPRLLAEQLARPAVDQRLRALELIEAMSAATMVEVSLVKALEDADCGVRAEAARLLAKSSGSSQVVSALTASLEDQHATVRMAARTGLNDLGAIDVASGLIDKLQDEFKPGGEL